MWFLTHIWGRTHTSSTRPHISKHSSSLFRTQTIFLKQNLTNKQRMVMIVFCSSLCWIERRKWNVRSTTPEKFQRGMFGRPRKIFCLAGVQKYEIYRFKRKHGNPECTQEIALSNTKSKRGEFPSKTSKNNANQI